MEHNVIIQVAVLCGVFMGGFMGLYWLKSNVNSPKYLKTHVKDVENVLFEKIKENKKLKGQMAQQTQVPVITGDFDLSSADGVGNFIQEYAPALKKFVPKQYQHLLDQKGLVDLAVNVYKQNPEKAQQFLSKFIKAPGNKGKSAPGEPGIESFDNTNAI